MPPIFKLRSSSGKIVPIRASSPAEAFDILDEIEASQSGNVGPKASGEAKTQESWGERFKSRNLGGLSGITEVPGAISDLADSGWKNAAGSLLMSGVQTGDELISPSTRFNNMSNMPMPVPRGGGGVMGAMLTAKLMAEGQSTTALPQPKPGSVDPLLAMTATLAPPGVGEQALAVSQDLYHGRVPELAADAVNMAPMLLGSRRRLIHR